MKKTLSYIYAFIGFGALLLIDQLTKYFAKTNLSDGKVVPLIKNVLRFSYVQNTGAAFGMMSGKQVLFIILTFICLFAITFVYVKTPSERRYILLKVTLVVLASGAAGNLIDRLKQGYVDDFIDFYLINFPVFNVADIYVCVSMALLIILIIFVYKEKDLEFLKFKKKDAADDK